MEKHGYKNLVSFKSNIRLGSNKGQTGSDLVFNEIIKNRVHMLAKAKLGNPARDEVIDLTDDEIELLSKQANLLLQSFSSRFVFKLPLYGSTVKNSNPYFRPKEKSNKQIEDLIISLQDFEKHKNDPNTVLTRSHFFAVIQHVELVRQNTLTEDNVSSRRVSF